MSERIVVLGAGLAGLAVADELAARGARPEVYEADERTGGLTRTDRAGPFAADRLIHQFFTYNQRVVRYVEALAGDRILRVPRTHRAYWRGRFLGPPDSPWQTLRAVGLGEAARVAADYVRVHALSLVRQPQDRTLADWLVARFGRRLYERYLGPYLEKVWGVPGTRLSPDWGRQRVAAVGLADALRSLAAGPRVRHTSRFFYFQGGIGTLADRLAARVRGRGVEIHTGREAVRLFHHGGRVRAVGLADGTEVAADRFVATLPPGRLTGCLDPPPKEKVLAAARRLVHRAIVTVQLELDRPRVSDATVIQFPDPAVPFARLAEPRNFDPSLAPEGRTSLALELYCSVGDATWNEEPGRLAAACVEHLARAGLLRAADVAASRVRRTPDASPVYALGYAADLARAMEALAELENLALLGRTAAFSFRTMDEVLDEALTVAPVLLRGGRYRPA